MTAAPVAQTVRVTAAPVAETVRQAAAPVAETVRETAASQIAAPITSTVAQTAKPVIGAGESGPAGRDGVREPVAAAQQDRRSPVVDLAPAPTQAAEVV